MGNYPMIRFKLNLILIFVALLLMAAVFIFSEPPSSFTEILGLLSSNEFEITIDEPEPKIIEIRPFDDILEKIEEGKKLLTDSQPLNIVERGIKKKEISLAILDMETGRVFERRYWLEDEEVREANKLRTETCGKEDYFPLLTPSDGNSDFLIIVNWWNSYNSNLMVVDSDCRKEGRYVVAANKFLILNDMLAYPQDRTGRKYSDIVYVPYSEQLHREEVIQEGRSFLNRMIGQAFSELAALKIKSRAMPDKIVIETMTPTFVKNLFINEQSDPKSMILSQDGGKRIAERVLIRLGLNKEKAFRYTYSSVGALGLGQIMPQTYKNIRHDYPEADLIVDIGIGRADVLNAIKASILVLDDHFAAIVKNANQSSQGRKILSQKNEQEIEDIRAAIYNGGPGKYQHLTGNISMAIAETASFLVKLDMIRKLRLFD